MNGSILTVLPTMRVELGPSDDFELHDRLLAALGLAGAAMDPIESLSGFAASREPEQQQIGLGLNRFHVGDTELTVYRDAWTIDLVGPDELVTRVLDLLSSSAPPPAE